MSRSPFVLAALFALSACACAARTQTPPTQAKSDAPGAPRPEGKRPMTAESERIEETTVGTVRGWTVTVANIGKDRYRGADGVEREGVTAQLGVYDEGGAERSLGTVGEGSVVTIAGQRYRVARVQKKASTADNGWIELQAAP